MFARGALAVVLAVAAVAEAGCASGGGAGHDAGVRLDARAGDGGPLDAGSGTDGGGLDAGDPGLDADNPGLDAGDPGLDAADPGTDAPIALTDAGPPGTDAPPPDVPGDRCAGVSCAAFDGPCTTGMCNPSTGACSAMPLPNGTACDDGDRCSTGDWCLSGACQRGPALDCSAMTSACATGACDAATGTCVATPVPDGTSCGGGGACGGSTCSAGACVTSGGAADCTSCGASMYCVSGTCGASPTTLTYDFESGTLPPGWSNGVGGTAGWTFEASGAHGGVRRLRSGVIGNSAQSRVSLSITLGSAASLTFWLLTSSESGYDFLEVYVDSTLAGRWSGTTAWTQAGVDLGPGAHTIEWRYTKDGSLTAGSDLVAIDDVVLGPPAAATTGFESAALPAGYSTGGAAGWITDTTMPHSGSRSAASGTIGDSQTSSMFRTVTLASSTTLTYWYRVSTESGYDFLRVFVDGVMAGQWSGTVAWTMASQPLAAGTHTVEWRYAKDASLTGGSDRVWIDDVDFGPAPPGGPLCGP